MHSLQPTATSPLTEMLAKGETILSIWEFTYVQRRLLLDFTEGNPIIQRFSLSQGSDHSISLSFNCLVVCSPNPSENMSQSNWVQIFPNIRGENSKESLSCHHLWPKLLILGMVIPPLVGNSLYILIILCINPYHWVELPPPNWLVVSTLSGFPTELRPEMFVS